MQYGHTCTHILVPTITNHTHIWLTTPTITDHTHILVAWLLQMCSLQGSLWPCSVVLMTALSSICHKTYFWSWSRCLQRQTQLFGCLLMQRGGVNTNPTIIGAMKSDTGTESGKQCKDHMVSKDYDISNTIWKTAVIILNFSKGGPKLKCWSKLTAKVDGWPMKRAP